MKKQMEKQKARMLKKQVAFNLAAILLLVILLNFSILVYPKAGMQTRNTTIKFAWLGLASYAIVDDNPQFTSPLLIRNSESIEIEPGKYYWCVPFFNTCIKKITFEIQSEVSLVAKAVKSEDGNATYLVENTGNTATKIEIKNILGKLITGFFILQPEASNVVEINETAKIIAEQK